VGGIAHDFNNVLMAISANLAVARGDETAKGSTVRRELIAAEEAAYRGADTVRQLLTFSTKAGLALEPHSVNTIIERLATLARHTFDASVKFDLDLDERDPIAMFEATALEQVLLNLYVNAKDAMPNGGCVTTATRVQTNEGTDEEVILIRVTDDGVGIPSEIADQIFDPFFTTKGHEFGTGLGLSTSYRIIEQHGGTLAYKRRHQGGSEFQIILPLYQGDSPKPVPVPTIERGEGTVLVVDDDDVVRAVAESILRRHGYDTISAANGRECLDTLTQNYKRDGEPGVDLVLLDLTMPGMPGREVMQRIKENYPGTPVILCSGYLIAHNYESYAEQGPNAEIQKPYSVEELVATVNRVIQGVTQKPEWQSQ
jgi:CheY-like chemotaxis protein/anti-sigma regulatory factor (Ser/Thr protein kinase)